MVTAPTGKDGRSDCSKRRKPNVVTASTGKDGRSDYSEEGSQV